jgi:hypothetical protein
MSCIRSGSCGGVDCGELHNVWVMWWFGLVSCIRSGLYDGVDCGELHKVWFIWWCGLW